MAVLQIGALQWRLYSPDTPDLVAPYLIDFTQYAAYDFVPRGAQALLTTGSVASADGVVIDNMTNANDCTVTVGAVTEFVPRYQKVTIPLPGVSAPDVILSAAGGTTRVTFYTGEYHGTGSNINGYASNRAGAVATVTDGTIDALFSTIRFKTNYNLAAGYNLDNIQISGAYDVLNPTQSSGTALPSGTWYVEHHTYSSSPLYAFQIARNLIAPTASTLERRLLGGSGWTDWTAPTPPGLAPPGQMCDFAMATPPTGWLKANGASYSRTTYAALYAAIGTQYGSADANSFNVPDVRGYFRRALDDGRGIDPSRALGSVQGSANLSHGHGSAGTFLYAGGGTYWVPNDPGMGYLPLASAAANVAANGGSESRPQNMAFPVFIKY